MNIRFGGKLSAGLLLGTIALSTNLGAAQNEAVPTHIIEIKAETRESRSYLASLGYALEEIRSDRVFIYGFKKDSDRLSRIGFKVKSEEIKSDWLSLQADVQGKAARYRSYAEVSAQMTSLAQLKPEIASTGVLGHSVENRDIPYLRISGKSLAQAEAQRLPVVFYMGCHHAREHLSVEVPMMFAEYLVNNYGRNADVTRLVDSREIYVSPVINPDGHTYDYTDGQRGRMWRKNRSRNSDGTFGVDLNRNYGFGWGTGGSSAKPSDETFKGPAAFSEPESRAVRDFVNSQPRMTGMISFHTFSELVLYPWGHSYSKVGENGLGNAADLPVFKKMANTIAGWNHYTPEQSSDLYIASGDTTDWAYGEHGIFAFTIELSPSSQFQGGFYPSPSIVESTFEANRPGMMYLLDYADNPHRVMSEPTPQYNRSPVKSGIPLASFSDLRI